ncbi:hypothetical protein [Piscinibacter koreensis]|uniref:Big-1 domain-containing protein n=1 Tax=Piscinibacter koreensis TaxID=2742824 RepID=A0A7Y6TW44_9BURK|nr:hypothetical protein [Schlegelella koreensis]NUZ05642.1 hypothetical protein [Schlegelella koreensis]
MKSSKWMLLAAATSFLAACGGGGGNAGSSPFNPDSGGGSAACPPASASGAGGSTCGTATAAALNLQLSSSSINNGGAATVTATATATTASGQTLSGIPITFSVDKGASFTQSSPTTGANGQVTAVIGIGSDASNRIVTVTAQSGSLSAQKAFAVTGATLTGTRVPAIVAPSSTGNRVEFRLVDANGRAISNVPITVTGGTAGNATGTTGNNGDYVYTYTAPAATGSLEITGTAGGVTNTQVVSVQSSASTVPDAAGPILSASVSANPSVVTTNTATTNNRTEIRALFIGTNNAPIRNVRVRFDLNGDPASIGGTFSTGTSLVYSDAGGIATTAYAPGSRSSPTNGVTIRACYDVVDFPAGQCPNWTTATITVASDPLSVTIGTNATILTGATNLTYKRQFAVLVVDASGRAKGNVDIVPSIDIDRFYKGFYTRSTRWDQTALECMSEDVNRNGVLETGEDRNGNGSLEPRKSDVAVTILGNGKTDDAGLATVQIEYPQNVASWARVRILVAATGISGTEGRATWTEILPVPADAVTGTPPPAFVQSPYGVVVTPPETACANPN